MSASTITLRPYQRAAIDALLSARRSGIRRQLISLPTGAGKTVIFAELARMARRPVLVLAHREELLQQARDKLVRALGDSNLVGLERAKEEAPASAKVVVASLRSLRSERIERLRRRHDFGLIVYDECHHAPAEDNRRVLEGLGVFEADWTGTLLGFTATALRADGKGLDSIFEEIVFRRGIAAMVEDGYLMPLRGYRIATAADLHSVSGGEDFSIDELAEAVDIEERNALVARSIQELARDRRGIVFCVTVRHAINVRKALGAVGISAAVVHGQLKRSTRAKILREFREEKIQVITNVGVLTEGFDDPAVSCVAMARPTRSEGLYAQCVGRGMRPAPGKEDCLVLDFVDLSRLSLTTLPSLFGMPRQLDLRGEDAGEASREYRQIMAQTPGFEVEPGSITLAEIKRRAAGFDPLRLRPDDEVLAISGNGWWSLGTRGLILQFFRKKGRPSEFFIGRTRERGKRKYRVELDGKEKARFARIDDAVEAVDYEVARLGRLAAQTAREHAAWRSEPVDPALSRELSALSPPRQAKTRGEAMRLLAFDRRTRLDAHQSKP